MFGHPVARVAKRFGMLNKIKTLAQGLARSFTEDDGDEVEYGNGNHVSGR
jgi:hypothetical protein